MTCWCLLIFAFLCGSCSGATLWEAIQASTANISDFRKLVTDTSTSSFIDYGVTTVFIPTNAAYAKQYPSGVHTLPLDMRRKLVKSHLATLTGLWPPYTAYVASTSIFNLPTTSGIIKQGKTNFGVGQFIVLKSVDQDVPMYMVRSENTTTTSTIYDYFINNAELVSPNIDMTGGNGAFHVISEVIHPFGSSEKLHDFLKRNSSFTDFLSFVDTLSNSNPQQFQLKKIFTGAEDKVKSSFFAPTNAALNLPESVKTGIKENGTRLVEFLMSHIAPDQIIFSSWMKHRPEVKIQTMLSEKGLATKPLNSTIYLTSGNIVFVSVGGVTAQVLGSTQPLGNGALIVINQPLNLLYRNVRNILQSKASGFLSACDKVPACKNYVDGVNGICTVFAPQSFPSDLITNPMLNEVLMLHILPKKRLTLATLPASSVEYNGANDTGKLRFLQTSTDSWVTARLNAMVRNVYSRGFVGSMITEGDVAGTDGIVQILATNIGIPTKSIYQILRDRYSEFSKVLGYLDDTSEINLKTLNAKKQHYTFFAPTNKALEQMEAAGGKSILDNQKDRIALLKRLMLLNTVLLSNLSLNTQYLAVTALAYSDVTHEHTDMKIMMRTNRMKGVEASINIGATNKDAIVNPYTSEWGATNGIVYSLNMVPFDSSTVARVCKSGTTCKGVLSFRVSWTWSVLILFLGQALLRTL